MRFAQWTAAVAVMAVGQSARASDVRGLVTFNGLPVSGATVTVTQAGKKISTITDAQGFYSIPSLQNGAAEITVEMTGFAAFTQAVTVAADAPLGKLELKLLTLDQMRAELKPVLSAPYTEAQVRSEPARTATAPKPAAGQSAPAPPSDEVAQKATDGLLVNGSVNNAATSQFSLAPRFGNTASGKSLYTFSLNVRAEESALDAKSYSITGFDNGKPRTSDLTGGFAVQGPLRIPHLLRNGPNVYFGYQRTQDSVSLTTPGLVPTLAERAGDLSELTAATGQPIYAPTSGLSVACVAAGVTPGAAFAGGVIPAACISPSAQMLLNLYPLPLPNLLGSSQYNYQIPIVTDTHQDAFNSNASKTIGRKDQVSGAFSAASTRTSFANLLGFTDATHTLGLVTNVNWAHTFNARYRSSLTYQYSRQSNRLTPYWANRANISGLAGITGNDQDPAYWGPPTLTFSSGLTSLTDGQSSFSRNQTNGIGAIVRWNRSPHNVTVGADLKRSEFNYLTQANPRGTFQFTGAATGSASTAGAGTVSGSDVADFLLGLPDASSVTFGNADKYLRQWLADAYAADDWRVSPQLTVNAGLRWEYGAPITEIKDRLVNLDVAPNYTAIAPVVAGAPKGSLTGTLYPSSLTRPDRTGFQPRVGVSWRPLPGSSLLIRAGYGITYDTSVYQGIALNLAQQAPFAKSIVAQSSPACPLTLATGFSPCVAVSQDTFGIDPNFRVGYVQTWDLAVQRDLPGSLQMVATYLGNKGTRGVQEFLPNTNPIGAINPCPTCPTGFKYLTSTGNSTRESAQLQLRRRLKNGFTASVLYVYSKSIDDDSALGGQGAATVGSATLAQDWRNLAGERGLSIFDQRHVLNLQAQYTTGQGKGGGTLLTGWRGRLYKEWTVQTQINAASGLPETPLDTAEIVSGYSAFIRPNVTGAPLYGAVAGRALNPAAFTAPAVGQFGNARRDSIVGPQQFTLNAALVRTFRLPEKRNLDLQVSAANALNHVSYSSFVTNINSTQFGLPAAANAMRMVQVGLRLRF